MCKRICFFAVLIALFASLLACSGESTTPSPKTQPSPPINASKPSNPLPAHTILSDELDDSPSETYVDMAVLIPEPMTKDQLTTLLNGLYASIMARTNFKYRSSPTKVAIRIYASKEKAASAEGWVAILGKMHDAPPQITIDDIQFTAMTAKPEKKLGMDEARRIRIYQELIKAETRAFDETQRAIPNDYLKQGEYQDKLESKYDAEIARKYKLTKDQLDQITIEGGMKGWPKEAM